MATAPPCDRDGAGATNGMTLQGRHTALTAALGFARLEPRTRELELLHGWLDTWREIGDVVVGMPRQDYDLQLTRYDGRGWRATFYTTGSARVDFGRPQVP